MCANDFSCFALSDSCCMATAGQCDRYGGVKTCRGEKDPRLPSPLECKQP
eukprot:m.1628 g.1628  ORF g.1628 m.1628 type:complete len:50 (-) comp1677_c0_seq1:151-300(-)